MSIVRLSRLTVVESVYHQSDSKPSTPSESRFDRRLLTDEQMCFRHSGVGQEWKPLETGWIKRASMVVITNLKEQLSRTPTKEQQIDIDGKILLVGIRLSSIGGAPCIVISNIPPGESIRFSPPDLGDICLRCVLGNTKYSVALFPE